MKVMQVMNSYALVSAVHVIYDYVSICVICRHHLQYVYLQGVLVSDCSIYQLVPVVHTS